MKILFIDLSGSEDYSGNKYGGIGRSMSILSKNISDFWLAGGFESFKNVEEFKDGPNVRNKINLSQNELNKIRATGELDGLDDEFNIIVHTNTNVYLQTNKKTLVWVVGQHENIHPKNTNLLCHNFKNQQPNILNPETKIFEFVLGVEMPVFQEYKKESFIFQCSNHYPQINSHVLASWCNAANINCIFAGPIADGYGLFLKSINGRNTRYLGEITEETKIDYLKRAALYASLFSHPINEMTLGCKQALSYGCGLVSTKMGAMKDEIVPNFNGFFVNTGKQLWDVCDSSLNIIKQKNCYDSVQKYSVNNMVDSFKKVLEQI